MRKPWVAVAFAVVLLTLVAALGWWKDWDSVSPSEGVPQQVLPGIPTPEAVGGQSSFGSQQPERRSFALPTIETESETEPVITGLEFLLNPVLVRRYQLRIHAVDIHGNSVPEASVVVSDGRKTFVDPPAGWQPRSEGALPYTYLGRRLGYKPVLIARTDATGRCSLNLDREILYLMVSKEGVGVSADIGLLHTHPEIRDGKELVVTLRQRVTLRGLVLRGDNSLVAGAEVRVKFRGGTAALVATTVPREPTKTDRDGRFAILLAPHTIYAVLVSDGEDLAFPEKVHTMTPGDREVVVRFPGAITIGGFLLDELGKPVAKGQVKAWEKVDVPPENREPYAEDPFTTVAKTAGDGSFEMAVKRFGTYQVLGSASDRTASELLLVQVSPARPHVNTLVNLKKPLTIAGRIRHVDGEPAAGVRLYLKAEAVGTIASRYVPKPHDLFPRIRSVESGKDGSFRFEEVHPGTTYTVTCIADQKRQRILVLKTNVVPGNQRLLLELGDSVPPKKR